MSQKRKSLPQAQRRGWRLIFKFSGNPSSLFRIFVSFDFTFDIIDLTLILVSRFIFSCVFGGNFMKFRSVVIFLSIRMLLILSCVGNLCFYFFLFWGALFLLLICLILDMFVRVLFGYYKWVIFLQFFGVLNCFLLFLVFWAFTNLIVIYLQL